MEGAKESKKSVEEARELALVREEELGFITIGLRRFQAVINTVLAVIVGVGG